MAKTIIFGYPRPVVISGNTIILKKVRFEKEVNVTYVQPGFSLGNITPGTPESKLITAIGGLQANGDFHMEVADIGTWVTGDRISPMESSTVTWYATRALLTPNITDDDTVLVHGPFADTNADSESDRWQQMYFDGSTPQFSMLGMYPGCEFLTPNGKIMKQFGATGGNYTALGNFLWKNIIFSTHEDLSVGHIILGVNTTWNDKQVVFERCALVNIRTLYQRTGGTGAGLHFRSCLLKKINLLTLGSGGPPALTMEACTFVAIDDMGFNLNTTSENGFYSECKLMGGFTSNNGVAENSDALSGTGNTDDETSANLKLFRDNCNDLKIKEYFPVTGSTLIAAGANLPDVLVDYFGDTYDNSIGYSVAHSATPDPDHASEGDVRFNTIYANTTRTGNMTLPGVSIVRTPNQFGTNGTEFTGTDDPDFPARTSVLTTDTVNELAGLYQAALEATVTEDTLYGENGTGRVGTFIVAGAASTPVSGGLLMDIEKRLTHWAQLRKQDSDRYGESAVSTISTVKCFAYIDQEDRVHSSAEKTHGQTYRILLLPTTAVALDDEFFTIVDGDGDTIITRGTVTGLQDYRHPNFGARLQTALLQVD